MPWWYATLLKALTATTPGRTFTAVLELMNLETGVEALELLRGTPGPTLACFRLVLLQAIANTTGLGDPGLFAVAPADVEHDPAIPDGFITGMDEASR